MRGLDINKSGDFLKSGKDFQSIWMHSRITRAEGEIGINLLETGKGMIQDGDGSFNDGTISKTLDVSSVDNVNALAGLGTRSVADDALSVDGLLLGWANADASAVVLEQMLRTRFDAGGAVSVLAFRVRLPRVRDGIVALHCRTFLFADAIVEEISASLTCQMTTRKKIFQIK